MRIAIVFDNMIYGGIERVGITYVKLIQELGHEVDAYVLNPHTEDILKELEKECNIVTVLNYKRCYAPDYWKRLDTKFKWGKYVSPIICAFTKILNSLFKFNLCVFDKILNQCGSDISRDYDIAIAFSGHMNDLNFVADEFIKSNVKIAWLHGNENEYIKLSDGFASLYKKIQNLVCLSDTDDEKCTEFNTKFGINKRKIYNPVIIKDKALDEKFIDELKQKYGDFCLMVGRLATDKDQLSAIKAVKYMNEKYSLDKKLVLVGDGSTREMLENYVEENKLNDMVIFAGNRADVQNWYSAAKVYVHSSPLEGLPTVLLEAMSFGVPIASTDSYPGVREILGDSEYGLVSPVEDYKALAENIYRLYSDQSLYDNYKRLGSSRFNDFTFDAAKTNIEKLFNELTKRNNMRFISCASYYGTGSSAITDFVSEYGNVYSFTSEEFRFVQDPDGISDLEYNLVENFNRHNSGHALKRYKKLVDYYAGNGIVKRYESFFHGAWKKYSYEYIDKLTDFKYNGWWFYDLYDRGSFYHFRKRIVNKLLHMTIWRNDPERVFNTMKNEITYCSHPSEEKFLQCTKEYIDCLFASVSDGYETVMVDQIVPPTNLKRFLRYFDDIKVVVVDRDPRDLFVLGKYVWKDGIMPDNVEDFVNWFKYTRSHRKSENLNTENITFIQFEDLVYKYDETSQKLAEWLELDEKDHINPKKCFDPAVSVKNTQVFKNVDCEIYEIEYIQSEIEYIQKELQEYLYDFENEGESK